VLGSYPDSKTTDNMRTSLLALAALASAAPSLKARQQSSTPKLNVTDAIWDGQCFYPEADDEFELEEYLGRWYQVAGTPAPFTEGCTCIYAEYTLNENGTVNVLNGCQLGDQEINIQGIASAADEEYGDAGVFRVQFPPAPPPVDCAGPNYIVQKYEPRWAIVQASNYSTLFLLSRDQQPGEAAIQEWLDEAGRLGTNLTDVQVVSQEGCRFT
jgi:apolipoprotein D and lipocalin family protein